MKLGTSRPISGKSIISALVGLSILVPCAAVGAVRCDGSLSKAEKVICNYEELVYLDQALNDAYAATLSAVSDKAALRKEQRLWLRSDRDTCGDWSCMSGVMRARIQALTSLRIAAQPVLKTPLDGDSARAVCSELASHVIAGKLDAFLVPPDPTIVGAEGYSVQLQRRKPAVRFSKEQGGGTCSSDAIFPTNSDGTPDQRSDLADHSEEAKLGYGTTDALIYFNQRYYRVTSDNGYGAILGKTGLFVEAISLEGGLRALCTINPMTSHKVVIHASDPAMCTIAAAGGLPSATWKTINLPQALLESAPDGLPGGYPDGVEETEVDLRGDGTTQNVARIRFTSGAGCGSNTATLAVVSSDLKEFPKNALADRLNLVRTSDDADIVLSGGKAFVVGMLDEQYPPGLVSLATDPPQQVCAFIHQTTYTVGTMFPISN